MIKEFQNEYRWLSNFAPCSITLDGVEYKSVEHAYMSAKSDDPIWKEICRFSPSPSKIKKVSRTIELVPDWEQKKILVMMKCLVQKFNQSSYKEKLIDTRDKYIQEGNYWGDEFWGVNLKTGKGKNLLGIMIMTIRETLE